jgi:hypothetical protein
VAHSFRHLCKDRLRAALVPEPIQRAIMGRSGRGVADSYGVGFPLRVLADALGKLDWPEITQQSTTEDVCEG